MTSHTQTSYDNKWCPIPFGLNNPNTLCYFNSLLQAIMSCTAPMQYMLEWPKHDRTAKTDNKSDNPLWNIYHTFMLNAMTETTLPKSAINIIDALKYKIISLKKSKFGNGQEDVGEGFHLLLDCMGDDEYAQHFMHRYEHDIYCPDCKKIVSSKSDTSFHLEIPPNYTSAIVEWCDDEKINYSGPLNQYMRHHVTILNDFKCNICNKTNRMIRLSHLVLVPNVLVVQFNKFAGKFITPCPDTLTFPSIGNKGPLNFKLVAKIEHSGNMGGGHYMTHALREKGIYLFNDSSVGGGNFDNSPNTYICFYHIK